MAPKNNNNFELAKTFARVKTLLEKGHAMEQNAKEAIKQDYKNAPACINLDKEWLDSKTREVEHESANFKKAVLGVWSKDLNYKA